MSRKKRSFGLFEAYGVELEYMIVDRTTLAVRPLADRLFHDVAGKPAPTLNRGTISWSNELVNHVIEFKVTKPVRSLEGISTLFQENVRQVNDELGRYDAMLLPSGAHPLMDPLVDTHLWPYEYNEIYSLYDQIFGCHGHGWSNLQSAHLNLPFRDDQEFGQLHAAIRILLPIVPALSASTPVLDGFLTGFADTRLETYRHNQDRIPSITGKVIPEAVFTEADYYQRIFSPMIQDIQPYDPGGILDHYFLNSRGAIARFDRGTIEIRVIDLQENPLADLSVIAAVVSVLQMMVAETWAGLDGLKSRHEDDLARIFLDIIREGEHAVITDADFLRLFGIPTNALTARELWWHLLEQIRPILPSEFYPSLVHIVENGSLSSRIVRQLQGDVSEKKIQEVYRQLARCLAQGEMFI